MYKLCCVLNIDNKPRNKQKYTQKEKGDVKYNTKRLSAEHAHCTVIQEKNRKSFFFYCVLL